MRQPLTIDQARVIEANGAGTTFLEAAAVEVQALLDQGTASLRDSEAAMSSAFGVTLGAALDGALVTAVFALAAWLALGRSIGLPVAGLTAIMGRMTEGHLDDAIPGTERGDELGRSEEHTSA